MNLYEVQDDDRPCYVSAPSWLVSLEKWQEQIIRENPGHWSNADPPHPKGIRFVTEKENFLN